MFKIQFWHTGAAQFLSFGFALYALLLLIYGEWEGRQIVTWSLVWLLCHYSLTGIGSICGHSLGSHLQKVAPMKVLRRAAVLTPVLVIGDLIQWCLGHDAHHLYYGTEQDPHNVPKTHRWRGLFLGRYVKPQRYRYKEARRLTRDPFIRGLHSYALLVPFALLALLSGVGALTLGADFWMLPLFGYLAPLFTALMAGAAHNVYAHGPDGEPRNLPWLFLLMPWEWSHKDHHAKPGSLDKAWSYKWMPDPAAWILRPIMARIGR